MKDIYNALKNLNPSFANGVPANDDGAWVMSIDRDGIELVFMSQCDPIPASVYYGHTVCIVIGAGLPRLDEGQIDVLAALIEEVTPALDAGDDRGIDATRRLEDYFYHRQNDSVDFVADYDWSASYIDEGVACVKSGRDLDEWLKNSIPEREHCHDGVYVIYDKGALRSWIMDRVDDEI